jgi:hypothetical protein
MNEIEELRVQIDLGKMEAKDLFEEVKKKFSEKIREAKEHFSTLKNNEEVLKVINAFEHLQLQLNLGIAETEDIFEEQRKKLDQGFQSLETALKSNPVLKEYYAKLQLEIEKFKIKMELLGLKYKLKTIRTEYNFEEKKARFFEKLDGLRDKAVEKEEVVTAKWENFQKEVTEAYSHLKKAFKQ